VYSAIARNRRYSTILFVIFGLVAVAVSVWFSVVAESPWPAVFILGFTAAYTWWQFRAAVGIVARLAGCVEVTAEQEPELHRAVQNLAIRNGMPMPKVCVINDSAANAIAVGMGPDDAVIALTRGTLDLLTRSELEGVVAHELAHIKNLDSRVKLTIFSLVGAFAALTAACWSVAGSIFSWSHNGKNPLIAVALVLTVAGAILAVVAFLVGPVVKAAMSREREYLADASAFEMTRYADGLTTALAKMEDAGASVRRSVIATSSFYFLNPLRRGFWSRMLSSHPSTMDRIERLMLISRSF
jgi:heat shock protein HtpX